MGALKGGPGERAARAVEAGCDIALACTGRLDESAAVLEAVPDLAADKVARFDAAAPPAPSDSGTFDPEDAAARLHELLGTPVA
jgi:beta-N-acetylhexosaminidase